jgi:hypothetical protein
MSTMCCAFVIASFASSRLIAGSHSRPRSGPSRVDLGRVPPHHRFRRRIRELGEARPQTAVGLRCRDPSCLEGRLSGVERRVVRPRCCRRGKPLSTSWRAAASSSRLDASQLRARSRSAVCRR